MTQHIVDQFETICTAFGFKISSIKTKEMFTNMTDKLYINLILTVDGTSLAVFETFTYLGSTL